MAETRITVSPFCACLKSKKIYFLERPPQSEKDVLDGSARVWCQKTMDAIGADGEIVDPVDCRERRSCFVPYGVIS